jgi:precorrin-2 dehydrogenase/sirohydrochlorin ferrochelatase
MAFGYPVLLELAGRRAVVVGELAVAAGKVEGLLAAGAAVTVVAPGPAAVLERLEAEPGVTVRRRAYRRGDLAGAFLCVAGSADPAVRAAVAAEARAGGVLVNVMDDVPNCDFAAPAVVRRRDLLIAIGTGGRSPALARKVREDLEERYGEEWAEVLEVVGAVREETLEALPDLSVRARKWRRALDLDEAAALVRAGLHDELRRRLLGRLLAGEEVA